MITVKYFASLREKTGRDQDLLEYAAGMTVKNVWEQLQNNADTSDDQTNELLCARNQEYCRWETAVNDGDEIAFFPPVTGG